MNSQGLMPKPPVLNGQVNYQGWTDIIKKHLSQFDPRTVDAALFGIGGFIVGYLLKNFGRLLFMALAGLAFLLVVLHVMQVYTLDIAGLKAMVGVSKSTTVSDLVSLKIAWVKENPLSASVGLLGIILGWKVG